MSLYFGSTPEDLLSTRKGRRILCKIVVAGPLIEDAIGKQLASSADFMCIKRPRAKRATFKIHGVIKQSGHFVYNPEEDLIDAIDIKYSGRDHVEETITYMVAQGCYTQEDIGNILGYSQQHISRLINTMCKK